MFHFHTENTFITPRNGKTICGLTISLQELESEFGLLHKSVDVKYGTKFVSFVANGHNIQHIII